MRTAYAPPGAPSVLPWPAVTLTDVVVEPAVTAVAAACGVPWYAAPISAASRRPSAHVVDHALLPSCGAPVPARYVVSASVLDFFASTILELA